MTWHELFFRAYDDGMPLFNDRERKERFNKVPGLPAFQCQPHVRGEKIPLHSNDD